MFAQAYENRGDLWENSREDQCKPETEVRGLHMLEILFRFRFNVSIDDETHAK